MDIAKVNSQIKYYIHQRLKSYLEIEAWHSKIIASEKTLKKVPKKKLPLLQELLDRFHYQIHPPLF